MAELRQSNPEYVRKQCAASKSHYWSMTEEERRVRSAQKAEYLKQYRADNREKLNRLDAERYAANRDEHRENNRARYAANPEWYKARAKARHAADPARVAARAVKWNKENPERRSLIGKVSSHKRRALMEGAGGVVTGKQLRHLFERQGGKCAGCKKRVGTFEEGKWHHDHVMPIALVINHLTHMRWENRVW